MNALLFFFFKRMILLKSVFEDFCYIYIKVQNHILETPRVEPETVLNK